MNDGNLCPIVGDPLSLEKIIEYAREMDQYRICLTWAENNLTEEEVLKLQYGNLIA